MFDHVRVTTRIPADLYKALQKQAEDEDRSVNGQLVALLRKALNASPQKGDARDRANGPGIE